jgi:magnesium-transporting ATPase (P-type)
MAADTPDELYRGTHVVDGLGRMVVTAVGDETELGQIAAHLRLEGGPWRKTGSAGGCSYRGN